MQISKISNNIPTLKCVRLINNYLFLSRDKGESHDNLVNTHRNQNYKQPNTKSEHFKSGARIVQEGCYSFVSAPLNIVAVKTS